MDDLLTWRFSVSERHPMARQMNFCVPNGLEKHSFLSRQLRTSGKPILLIFVGHGPLITLHRRNTSTSAVPQHPLFVFLPIPPTDCNHLTLGSLVHLQMHFQDAATMFFEIQEKKFLRQGIYARTEPSHSNLKPSTGTKHLKKVGYALLIQEYSPMKVLHRVYCPLPTLVSTRPQLSYGHITPSQSSVATHIWMGMMSMSMM